MKRFLQIFVGAITGIILVATCERPGGMNNADGGISAGQDALASATTQTLTADTDINQLQTGTITVAAMSVSAVILTGPFIVTDLGSNTNGSCYGEATTPAWRMLFGTTGGNAVHGARLVVKAGESLTIKNTESSSCSFVYSGFRPY